MDIITINKLPFDGCIDENKLVLLYDNVIIAIEKIFYGMLNYNDVPHQGFFVSLPEDDIQLNSILDHYNKTKELNSKLATAKFIYQFYYWRGELVDNLPDNIRYRMTSRETLI